MGRQTPDRNLIERLRVQCGIILRRTVYKEAPEELGQLRNLGYLCIYWESVEENANQLGQWRLETSGDLLLIVVLAELERLHNR